MAQVSGRMIALLATALFLLVMMTAWIMIGSSYQNAGAQNYNCGQGNATEGGNPAKGCPQNPETK